MGTTIPSATIKCNAWPPDPPRESLFAAPVNIELEVLVSPAVFAAVVNVVGVPDPGAPTPGSPVEILPPAFVADAPGAPPSAGGVGASPEPSDAGLDS